MIFTVKFSNGNVKSYTFKNHRNLFDVLASFPLSYEIILIDGKKPEKRTIRRT